MSEELVPESENVLSGQIKKEGSLLFERKEKPLKQRFTVIRKYLQQLITNADRQVASKNRELITFKSSRLSVLFLAFLNLHFWH